MIWDTAGWKNVYATSSKATIAVVSVVVWVYCILRIPPVLYFDTGRKNEQNSVKYTFIKGRSVFEDRKDNYGEGHEEDSATDDEEEEEETQAETPHNHQGNTAETAAAAFSSMGIPGQIFAR